MDENAPGQGAHQGRVLEEDRKIAQQPDQGAGQGRVDEIGEARRDADEADLGDQLVQLRLAEQGLGAGPSQYLANQVARHEDRVPRIGFEAHRLAAVLQQLVNPTQQRRGVLAVEDVLDDDVAEAPAVQGAGERGEPDVLDGPGNGIVAGEARRGDRVAPAGGPDQGGGEKAAPGADLEDRLAGQEMDQMAERLGLPQQTVRGDGIPVHQVPVAVAFPLFENGKKGGPLARHQRHPPILPEAGGARKNTLKAGQSAGLRR